MAYTKKIWKDYPDATTPINAEDLNNIEDGLETVDTALENLNNNVNNIEDGLETVDTSLNSGWISLTGTFTFVSWDSTTYTGVVNSNLDLTSYLSVGMKVKFTQSATVKFGIITAITSTQLTLFLGTDYSLNNSGISNAFYSMLKAPYGFPMDPAKWTLKYEATVVTSITNPVSDQWYNLATLNLPIGLWDVTYNAVIATTAKGTAPNRCYITIGQTSASQGSAGCMTGMNTGATAGISLAPATNNKIFNLASAGAIYLTFMTNQSATYMIDVYANGIVTTIRAVCGYL
jgi:hypothetical protein